MNEDMKTILSAISDLKNEFNSRFNELDSKFEEVIKTINEHHLENIRADDHLMSLVKQIAEGQERQERILEILSKRSIEHESYIRKQF